MAENDDILRKADALHRWHAPPQERSGEGGDVPVLTDLITPGGAPQAPAAPDDAPVTVPSPPSDDEGAGFDPELIARITVAVQTRLAHDLERRIKQHEIASVDPGFAAAMQDFEQDIASAVSDAIAEVLARPPQS